MSPMYAAGPPVPSDLGPGGGRLRVSAAARRAFQGPPGIAGRPGHQAHLHAYLSDLVRPYGLSLDAAGAGAGHSYGEMASALIPELVPPDRPVDLVVLAFAIPDVRPGRATATYLSELCPGGPLAFAICDQGRATAFTGLRLVEQYARDGTCRQALLLVVEQAGLPYDAGLPADVPFDLPADVPVDVPAGHTAVGLRCEEVGPAGVTSVRQHADVPPERVAQLLAADLTADLTDPAADAAEPAEVSLIADAYLADRIAGAALAGRVRVVPDGRPFTGGWWELAGMLGRGSGDSAARGGPPHRTGERVVLASYDRQLRYLCSSTMDIQTGREPGP